MVEGPIGGDTARPGGGRLSWKLMFWLSWPLAFILGAWADYALVPDPNAGMVDRVEELQGRLADMRAELRKARAETQASAPSEATEVPEGNTQPSPKMQAVAKVCGRARRLNSDGKTTEALTILRDAAREAGAGPPADRARLMALSLCVQQVRMARTDRAKLSELADEYRDNVSPEGKEFSYFPAAKAYEMAGDRDKATEVCREYLGAYAPLGEENREELTSRIRQTDDDAERNRMRRALARLNRRRAIRSLLDQLTKSDR